jgi:hypothetical protein
MATFRRLHHWHPAPLKRLQLVGFPRSANTYLAQWCGQSRLPLVATHHHWDYELQDRLLAAGVTTYVLVREPAAVIASCMVWNTYHGSSLEEEVKNVNGHYDLWRQFHHHALDRLVSRGARVVCFEYIVDRSVAVLLKADGFRLRSRWSKERYEQRQRTHLREQAADPATNLGSAFTGLAKPELDVPPDICATYKLLKSEAEQMLLDARKRTEATIRKLARAVRRRVRPPARTAV